MTAVQNRITIPWSESPRVSVIVPSSAAPSYLISCLQALQRAAPRVPFETVVVRNEADQQTLSLLQSVQGIRIEASPVNLGLAGSGNRGRSLARGELLLLLHDDAEVEPEWMEALVAAAEEHPEAGAIGSRVLDPDGGLQSAGMILWRDGLTAPPWLQKPSSNDFRQLRAVDYCGTSSLLVRASTWDSIGGLDENFYPVYYVDVDLAMAVRAAGQVVLYQPDSVIRHHRGASGERAWQLFVSARNRVRLLEKWDPQLQQHELRIDNSLRAIKRALKRAEDWHRHVSALPRAETKKGTPRKLVTADHDLIHSQLASQVRKEFEERQQKTTAGSAVARPFWNLRPLRDRYRRR